HRLQRPPVGGLEERLDGAVVGARLRLHGQGRKRHVGGEPLAQRRRQVRHLLVGGGAARDPLPHLRGAVGGLAGGGEGAVEAGAVHPPSVRTGRTGVARGESRRMKKPALLVLALLALSLAAAGPVGGAAQKPFLVKPSNPFYPVIEAFGEGSVEP